MSWDITTDTVEVEIDMATETPMTADWGEIGGTLSDQTDLQNALDGKQDVIADLSTIRSGASAGATAYQKPASGIPSTDMATAVQTSLGKADSALQDAPSDNKQYARKNGAWSEVTGGGTGDHTQLTNRDAANQHPISAINGLQAALDGKGTYSKPASGIPKADLASSVQTSLGKADTALQQHQSLAAYRTAAQQDAIHDATKQDVISDLSTIRSGAALGATALQSVPNTYRTSAAQDVIDAGKASTSDIPTIEWVS